MRLQSLLCACVENTERLWVRFLKQLHIYSSNWLVATSQFKVVHLMAVLVSINQCYGA